MRLCTTPFRVALLGSALAFAAFAPAVGATSADSKRILAVTGLHSSASLPANGIPSGFRSAHQPATYTVLHNFAGGSNDGEDSSAGVTLDSAGNIYGTTDFGGANNAGTLFKLTPGGALTLLHSFGGTGDGADPDGAVTLIKSTGDIYGTTQSGGTSGNGTLFKLAADGTYTVLHNFDGTNDGSFVRGRLVRAQGNLYGTALFGGVNGDGTVFEYSKNGTFTVLHAFNGTDGEFPEHGVTRDSAGNLYGATAFGGAHGEGAVYEIAAGGTFSTVYSFTGGTDGGFLYGGVDHDGQGNVYGSTASGGANSNGTVFELAPNGTLTTLYNFTGGADGGDPEGDMLRAGKDLYSTASTGGDPSCNCGAVYRVKPSGAEKVLQAFTGANGSAYAAGVTNSNGVLYGTTSGGGADGFGVVFSVTRR